MTDEMVMEVRARVVLNATGPWSDSLRKLAEPQAGGGELQSVPLSVLQY